MEPLRVLITGVNGFIGKHLRAEVDKLTNVHSIVGLSRNGMPGWHDPVQGELLTVCCDISHKDTVRKILSAYKPNLIFHLAGNSSVAAGHDELLKTNLVGTHNLLENCPKDCRFIFASSATVYSEVSLIGGANEFSKLTPKSFYGVCKLACERFMTIASRRDLRSTSVRLVANTGPNPTHGCVKDFVEKLMGPGKTLECWGECPGSFKPYVYVNDTARALLKIAMSEDIPAINLVFSGSDVLSIEEVAKITMEATGIEKEIEWLTGANFEEDNRVVRVTNTMFKSLFPDFIPECPTSRDAVFRGAKEYYQCLQKKS